MILRFLNNEMITISHIVLNIDKKRYQCHHLCDIYKKVISGGGICIMFDRIRDDLKI